MSAVYLCAFSSLYVQVPGLYGDNGILPAKLVINKEAESFSDLVEGQPTLLRLLPKIGLDVTTGMDFLCLGGMLLSFVAMVARSQRNCVVFGALWLLYLSLFQVGQTFLWFQWDILLLEAGFLTVLVAPLNLFGSIGATHHQHDKITLWLVKWLLFRLMFASGVVKLTSQCPTWWGLTALNYHYETQCLPTPVAWFFHQLPEWFQKLSVVITFVIEIPLPLLCFSPVRGQRLLAFWGTVLLMVLIIITGNYNFFNVLTITLCLVLLDDNFLRRCMGKTSISDEDEPERLPVIGPFWRPIRWALNLLVYGAIIYWTIRLFSLRLVVKPSVYVSSKIAFSSEDLEKFLKVTVPLTIWLGLASLSWEVLKALLRSLVCEKGLVRKLTNTVGCVVFGLAAFAMFGISLVPHTMVDRSSQSALWPRVKQLHAASRPYKLTSPYGLFRRMTGVGGRPEVIVEGSQHLERGWKEYDFLHKPGNISSRPTIVAPHQPRLDWQMWFAALGTYQHNPWFLNMVYRLLNNQPEVLGLIGKNPFPDQPPRYIRATLYHYYFTRWDKSHEWHHDTHWWVRKRVREYLPVVTRDEPSFINYLKQAGILQTQNPGEADNKPNFLKYIIGMLRRFVGQPEGFIAIMTLFFGAFLLTFLDPSVKVVEWPKS
jgi:hypothetical protein